MCVCVCVCVWAPQELNYKAASQEERIHLWKEHFKNLFGKCQKLNMNLSQKLLIIK